MAAVNPARGEVVWQRTMRPLGGDLVATAGGLVFAGQTSGWFDAYDDKTGERVCSFHVGARCNAAPITYRVGGRQYVAVACGGHEMLDPEGGRRRHCVRTRAVGRDFSSHSPRWRQQLAPSRYPGHFGHWGAGAMERPENPQNRRKPQRQHEFPPKPMTAIMAADLESL